MHEKGRLRNFQGEQSESVQERRWVSDTWCLSVHGRWDVDSGDMFPPPPERHFVSLKSEGTAQFPSLAPLSPHLCYSYIQSLIYWRAIFPAIIKPLRVCGWPCCVLVLPVGVRMCQALLGWEGGFVYTTEQEWGWDYQMCVLGHERKRASHRIRHRGKIRRCSYQTVCVSERKKRVLFTAFLHVFDEYHKF